MHTGWRLFSCTRYQYYASSALIHEITISVYSRCHSCASLVFNQFEVIEAVGALVPEEAWRLLNDRFKTHPAVRFASMTIAIYLNMALLCTSTSCSCDS
jgi:hypothetical protein